MKAIVQFGSRITLEIEADKLKELLFRSITLAYPRKKCNVCGAEEGFYPTSNKDKKGNVYINIKCGKCGARSKLGELMGDAGFFWHDFEQYIPGKKEDEDGD